MNVLWITNIMLPPLCKALGRKEAVSGGWLFSSASDLVKRNDIALSVATIYEGKELLEKRIGEIRYFLLPSSSTKYDKGLENYWIKINDILHPDVVHIHGTEYSYGLAYLKACGNSNVVVSIQGMVSVISRYYTAGLSVSDILKNITLRDILRKDNIFCMQKQFQKRGEIEKEYINLTKHVIGRTQWDKSHVWAINPNLSYYHCNESLRDSFYKYQWSYEKCQKYRIFVSQAGYPLKGLHIVLKALPLVLRQYPDTQIYIAGNDIINLPWYRMTGYGKYIKKMIKKNHLEQNIQFTGPLDEFAMCDQYLKSNLFICPSSIENSPNSLSEAQILGVPCLASYVGGSPDFFDHSVHYLYRFEEFEMLAYKICEIFSNPKIQCDRSDALCRHHKEKNTEVLYQIYKKIDK